MTEDEFERLVILAYDSLPGHIKNLEDFPAIVIEDEVVPDIDQTALGLFRGIKRTQLRHNLVATGPNIIMVFRGPIIRKGGDISATVRRIVRHEVAHYLGRNEHEIKERGL